jgi:hypothetical protein
MPSKDKCPVCGKPCDSWTTTDYKIIQIMPANGIRAVYAETNGTLFVSPVAIIALAKATERYRTAHLNEEYAGTKRHQREVEGGSENQIVGIQLDGGYFNTCQYSCNFAGLCAMDEDPEKCLGSLDWSKNKEFEKNAMASGLYARYWGD